MSASGGYVTPIFEGMRRTVEVTSGEGRVTGYAVTGNWDGSREREVIDPAGLSTTMTESSDGRWRVIHAPDGIVTSDSLMPDLRFGMGVPVLGLRRTTLPSGLTRTVEVSRTMPSHYAPPAVTGTWTQDVSINSRAAYRTTFNSNPDSLILREYSPSGRVRTTVVDSAGRVQSVSVQGLATLYCSYDAWWRPTHVYQGGRGARFSYDAHGRLNTIRDTLGRVTGLSYLSDDRPTEIRLPGGRTIALSHDEEWNLVGITPPGRPQHAYEYNGVNSLSTYVAPGAGETDSVTAYSYDHDGVQVRSDRPGGEYVTASYGSGDGRLYAIGMGRGTTQLSYLSTGQLHTISSPDSIFLSYGYDGPVDTIQAWSGRATGSVSVALDRDFRVASQRVNGGNTVVYSYDADGLMTQAGDLSITRRLDNGLVSSTTLGNVTTTDSYSHVGELWRRTVRSNGTTLYEATYSRDSLGRVVGVMETVQGTERSYGFAYGSPDSGFVSAATVDGVTEHYSYDGNGNRLAHSSASDTSTATYDAQDRLLRYGGTSYAYTPAGELKTAATGADTIRYTYDALGNLVTVGFPSGDLMEYLVDGLSRRVACRWNGVLRRGWLYEDQLKPVAELDSVGNVVARYVYGAARNVPEYMVRNGNTYRIVSDRLGSVRLVLDAATGETVQRMDYDTYGRVLEDTNVGFQCFGYAGGLWDAATGLVRFGARDYDPGVGRWTCKDPAGLSAGGENLYLFAFGDPVGFTDPEGTWPRATDPRFGLSEEFWEWLHENVLPNEPHGRVLTREEARRWCKQWEDEGKPRAGKRKTWLRTPKNPPGFRSPLAVPVPVWLPRDDYFDFLLPRGARRMPGV